MQGPLMDRSSLAPFDKAIFIWLPNKCPTQAWHVPFISYSSSYSVLNIFEFSYLKASLSLDFSFS